MNEQKKLLVSIPDNDRAVLNQFVRDTSVTVVQDMEEQFRFIW